MARRYRGSGWLMVMSLILMAAFYLHYKSKNPDPVKIVASIDDKRITLPQLQTFAKNAFGSYEADKGKDMVQMMIDQELLIIHAEKTGILKNILQPRFEKQMKYARENLMLDMFWDIAAEENITISDADMQAYYDKQPLFILQSMQIDYSSPNAKSESEAAVKDLNRLQNFPEVYKLYFPDKIYSKTRQSNIINYYKLPVYLEDVAPQLSTTGKAAKPVESEQGYTIFYRDIKPTIQEASDFIYKDLMAQKTEEYKKNLIAEINTNSKISLFNLDKIYKETRGLVSDEVIVSNRMTGDTITERELKEKLADLYQVDAFYNLDYNQFIDYIILFIQQKVLLSLAAYKNEQPPDQLASFLRTYKPRPSNYYYNSKYMRAWKEKETELISAQNDEIVNYMLEKFYTDNKKSMSDNQVDDLYKRDPDLYRKSDFFKLQRIVLNNKGVANQVYKMCQEQDFEGLVMKYSNEPFKSKSKGIGAFLGKNMLEPSYDILYPKKVGDIVPPIEISDGVYHIYKIIDRIAGAVKPIDEVKSQVQTKLTFEIMRDYMKEIQNQHNIKVAIYEENLIPKEKGSSTTRLMKWFPDSYLRKLARGEV